MTQGNPPITNAEVQKALATTPAPIPKLASYPVNMDMLAGRFKLLLYGNSGVGKTTLAATAADHPDLGNVMFLNFEGGLISVAHRNDVLAVDIRSIKDLEDTFWKLQRGEYPGVKTVVIDSITEMQTLSLETVSAVRTQRDIAKGKENVDADMITLEDYGKSTAQLRRLMRWYRDLPLNIIVIALPKVVVIGQEKLPEHMRQPSLILPSLTEKLGNSVMGYMDWVWYYFQREVAKIGDGGKTVGTVTERVLVTRDRGVVRAKTRGHKFAASLGDGTIINPSLATVYQQFQDTQRKS